MKTVVHLEYEGRSARLSMQLPKRKKAPLNLERRTSSGLVTSVRLFNATRKLTQITADEIVCGDSELDFETAGVLVDPDLLSTAFIAETGEIVNDFEEIEILSGPEGEEKERRPRLQRASNINDLKALKVARLIAINDVLTSYVFRGMWQLVHDDSLSHDFLYGISEHLEKRKVMGLIGAGPKANQPLVIREGGSPYRAFLYGETGPERSYRLIMLLSNQELRKPE